MSVDTRPSVLALGVRRTRLEVLQFFRARDAVVFTLAFPVLLLAIFGSVFSGDVGESGVSFAQYFAAGMVASGIVRIVLAFQMKEGTPWIWVVLSGLITVLLGGMILLHWPLSSLWVLGVLLGVDLVFAGMSWIVMGLGLRKLA